MVDDPALKRFKQALVNAYGPRLVSVRLFGSRARGDHRSDSDYDVAVFLSDLPDRASERVTLANIATEIIFESGQFITPMPFGPDELNDRTPLMHEIRQDGIAF